MQKNKLYAILGGSFLLLGILFFLFKRSWIVVNWVPMWRASGAALALKKSVAARRKKLSIHFFKEGELKKQETTFLLSHSIEDNVKQVVGTWLSTLCEERVLIKQIALESVAISESQQELFLSFDQTPFDRH